MRTLILSLITLAASAMSQISLADGHLQSEKTIIANLTWMTGNWSGHTLCGAYYCSYTTHINLSCLLALIHINSFELYARCCYWYSFCSMCAMRSYCCMED